MQSTVDITIAIIVASLLLGGWSADASACEAYPGDANGDLIVDINDVLYVISVWSTEDEDADFNDDGLVAIDDLLVVLDYFGHEWPDGEGGLEIPNGICPCDYICSWDRNDPSSWPPEFQTAPPDVVQAMWDLMVDGLLDEYGCGPCPEDPVGACCNEATGACVDGLTEAECIFPGAEWLGEGSVCIEHCG